MWARQPIDVTIVAGSVQLSKDGKVIRVHPIRHDRSRELGAFANPQGRPRRKNSVQVRHGCAHDRERQGTEMRPRSAREVNGSENSFPARMAQVRTCFRGNLRELQGEIWFTCFDTLGIHRNIRRMVLVEVCPEAGVEQ